MRRARRRRADPAPRRTSYALPSRHARLRGRRRHVGVRQRHMSEPRTRRDCVRLRCSTGGRGRRGRARRRARPGRARSGCRGGPSSIRRCGGRGADRLRRRGAETPGYRLPCCAVSAPVGSVYGPWAATSAQHGGGQPDDDDAPRATTLMSPAVPRPRSRPAAIVLGSDVTGSRRALPWSLPGSGVPGQRTRRLRGGVPAGPSSRHGPPESSDPRRSRTSSSQSRSNAPCCCPVDDWTRAVAARPPSCESGSRSDRPARDDRAFVDKQSSLRWSGCWWSRIREQRCLTQRSHCPRRFRLRRGRRTALPEAPGLQDFVRHFGAKALAVRDEADAVRGWTRCGRQAWSRCWCRSTSRARLRHTTSSTASSALTGAWPLGSCGAG